MADSSLKRDLISLEPKTIIELFIIDSSYIEQNQLPVNEQIIYLCNFVTEDYTPIYWGGKRFAPTPCKFQGQELKGDGQQLARPTFQIQNFEGIAQQIIKKANGFLGAKIFRIRVLAKNLDILTWGQDIPFWADENQLKVVTREEYLINRKISENKQVIQYELVSPLDFENLRLPKRKMFANICTFEYRNGTGCQYGGPPQADALNKQFQLGYGYNLVNKGEWQSGVQYQVGDYVYLTQKLTNEDGVAKKYYYVCSQTHTQETNKKPYLEKTKWIADACQKKLTGCVCRFNIGQLPFGGFPSLTRKGYQEG